MGMSTLERKPSHQVFAISIEPSPPKACFWHSTTLQPWSVSPVAEMIRKKPDYTNPGMQAVNQGFQWPILPTPRAFHPWLGWWLSCMQGTSLDIKPSAFFIGKSDFKTCDALNPSHQDLQPLLSLLLWTVNHPPTTGCSPTSWALSGHEPDCQSCNISGIFF